MRPTRWTTSTGSSSPTWGTHDPSSVAPRGRIHDQLERHPPLELPARRGTRRRQTRRCSRLGFARSRSTRRQPPSSRARSKGAIPQPADSKGTQLSEQLSKQVPEVRQPGLCRPEQHRLQLCRLHARAEAALDRQCVPVGVKALQHAGYVRRSLSGLEWADLGAAVAVTRPTPKKPTPAAAPGHAAIRPPKPATLKKYGLSLEEWLALLDAQGGTCAVCEKVPSSGRLVTDHQHVPGWKRLPAEQRKRFVRGLLCWTCNHYFLARGITVRKSQRVTTYLERYGQRFAGPAPANDQGLVPFAEQPSMETNLTTIRPICLCCRSTEGPGAACWDLGCQCWTPYRDTEVIE